MRRRGVDSLYVKSEAVPDDPSTRISSLVTLSASIAQHLRSSERVAESNRLVGVSLLGELSYVTTSLCRLQQQLAGISYQFDKHSGLAACFDTTVLSLRQSLLLIQAEVSCQNPGDDASIKEALQHLRDQRPALEFLMEMVGGSGSTMPPTPPPDSLQEPNGAGSSLLPPVVPTGLTPCVDTKGWIEPPPEYSPPSESSAHLVHPEKADHFPIPPEHSKRHGGLKKADDGALYDAVTSNDPSLVSHLLIHSAADVNKSCGDLHRTPLHQAAHLNHPKLISTLLQHGALLTLEDSAGDTALHLAAWAGNVEALSTLLKSSTSADVDILSGRDAYSPLWCALSAHHIDAARLLLRHGARVSLRSVTGSEMLPLHQAAVTSQSAMCELLLERGAQVDALDEGGSTALHYAAASGSEVCVNVLLRAGAEIGVRQAQGLTPGHWAAHKGHVEVLGMLLDSGAEVNAKAEEGAMLLHLAANRGHSACVRLLLKKGGRRDIRGTWDGTEDRTAAEMAEAKGHGRVAKEIESWRKL